MDGVAINHSVRDLYAAVYFSEAVKHLRNCAKCRNYSTKFSVIRKGSGSWKLVTHLQFILPPRSQWSADLAVILAPICAKSSHLCVIWLDAQNRH